MKKIYLSLVLSLGVLVGFGQDLVITGAYDGPNTGGTPKGVELFVLNDIPDLSLYAIGSANNGEGTDGQEFILSGSAVSGSYIYIASESTQFAVFFGFPPDFTTGAMGINGDDAVELFYEPNGDFTETGTFVVIDVFGTIDCDPNASGTICAEWEHTDGWAYRKDLTGPDGSVFNSLDWTFSGTNELEGGSTNITCDIPFPIGTYTDGRVPSTKVSFANATGRVSEDLSFAYEIEFDILNESASAATTFDVELTTGSASDIDNYMTQTVTFAAGEGSGASFDINLTDNDDLTGTKTFVFTITNVIGGESAMAGSPAVFTLTVTDDEKDDLNELNESSECSTFYVVNVSLNEDMDTWTCDEGTYEANAFVGGGSSLATEVWLVSQPYNFEEAEIVAFEYSTVSGFDDQNNLPELMASFDYDGINGVSEATWISLRTIDNDDGEEVFVDLSSELAEEPYVVFGVKYADDGGSGAEEATLFDVRILSDADAPAILVWSGETDSDWANADNWVTGEVPSGSDFVYITDAADSNPVVNGDFAVDFMRIEDGMTVEVLSGSSLAIFGDVGGDGDMMFMRDIAGGAAYNVFGSPVENTDVADLAADFVFSYNTLVDIFETGTGPMTAGKGFFVAYNGAPSTLAFTGSPNTGQQDVFISDEGDGFNLVANPFPGHIRIRQLRGTNATDVIDGTFYFWEDGGTNDGQFRGGDYVTINAEDDVAGGTQAGQDKVNTGTIAPMQGFFVRAGSASNANMEFFPGMQVSADEESLTPDADLEDNFFRGISEERQKVRLAVTGNNLFNELLISFSSKASKGMDLGLDAVKLTGNELISFYSMLENEKLAIQALPSLGDEVVNVQLGMDLAEVGTYTLSLTEFVGIADNMNILVLDKLTEEVHDLSETGAFTFTNDASVYLSKRFELVMSPAAVLSIGDLEETNELVVFTNEQGLNVRTASAFDHAKVSIYTLSGAKVASFDQVSFTEKQSVINFDMKGLFVMTIESQNSLMVKKFLN